MPVDINGLLTTLDEKAIDRANLLVLYNFAESGSILNKAPNYSGVFPGALEGNPSFYYGSGTGFPNTDRVSVVNTGDFYSADFTHLFIIQRSGFANDNLFSSIAAQSGQVNSGYLISSNDAGKIVFSYKDCVGPKAVTSDFSINNFSHLAVTKNDNIVTIFQYTPVVNILEKTSFEVTSTEIFQSDYADLYYAKFAPNGFLKDYYSGFAYNYLYFNLPLSPNQIKDVFSGMYNQISISTGSPSGVDGSGFFILPTSGAAVTSGTPPAASALCKTAIVVLKPSTSGDQFIVDYDTAQTDILWNKQANYNFVKGHFTTLPFTSLPPVIYRNGQRLASGYMAMTGQFCATGIIWEFDYNLQNLSVVNEGAAYRTDDTIVYDLPTRNVWQKISSGSGSVNINTGSGLAVYLNGLRMLDYTISGSVLSMLTWASGDETLIDYYENKGVLGEIHSTGFFFTSGAYLPNSSRLYQNGQRLLLGTDYLEVVSGTLFQGAPLNQPTGTVVDITTSSYWNI